MKIGIIGSGDVGKTLAAAFAKLGNEVMIGSREPNKLADWAKENGLKTGNFADTAKFGELIALATLWTGTENALKLAGIENLAGKIIIDITNPLDFSAGAPPKLAVSGENSAGEIIQKLLPQSLVVKAFNIVGSPYMFKPNFDDGQPTMFICGNDDTAKTNISTILKDFGWESVDIGDISKSRLLESMAMLWITYGFKTNTWSHAFKLLKQ